jgi:hypothetical protein
MEFPPPRRSGEPGSDAQARVDRHLAMAEDAVGRKDWAAARAEVESAVRIDPAQHRAYQLHARIDVEHPSGGRSSPGTRRRRRLAAIPTTLAGTPDDQPPADKPRSKLPLLAGITPAVALMLIGAVRIANTSPQPAASNAVGCTPSAIVANQAVNGDLSNGDCESTRRSTRMDVFTFNGNAGDSIAVTMTGSFDTYLTLVGPGGEVVSQNDDSNGTNSRIAVSLPSAGTYRIEASAYGDARGSYVVTMTGATGLATTTAPVSTPAAASSLAVNGSCPIQLAEVGSTITGELGTSDCVTPLRSAKADLYAFAGVPGQGVTIEMTSTFDNYLYLVGPTGETIASNDDSNGSNARIQVTLPTAGTYTIHTTAYSGSGQYRLSVLTSPPAAGVAVPVPTPASCSTSVIVAGQTARGQLTAGDCFLPRRSDSKGDRYTFEGAAGQSVTIAMNAEFDTFLYLVAPDGSVVEENDDGDGRNARIAVLLPSTGTYTIEATAYEGGARGAYALSLSLLASSCTPAAIAVGETASGVLSDQDCRVPRRSDSRADQYTFTGVAGQMVTITMTGSFDTYLFLLDPSGAVVAQNDDADGTNSRIQIRLQTSGTFTIEAVAYEASGRGSYSLTLR